MSGPGAPGEPDAAARGAADHAGGPDVRGEPDATARGAADHAGGPDGPRVPDERQRAAGEHGASELSRSELNRHAALRRAPDSAGRSRMKRWARSLKEQVYTLYYCARDPRVPWYARIWILLVVGYALSPIDLIPDFIPVLGYLDDLLIVPLGVVIALRLVPKSVLAECRARAAERTAKLPPNRGFAVLIIIVWAAVFAAAAYLLLRQLWGAHR